MLRVKVTARCEPCHDVRKPGLSQAFVGGQLFVTNSEMQIPVALKVDTGCPAVMLADKDFLAVIKGLAACSGHLFKPVGENPWVQYLSLHRDVFRRTVKPWVTFSGPWHNVYEIAGVSLKLCNHGYKPHKRCESYSPIFGFFSYAWLYPEKDLPFQHSLLGRSVLNRLNKLTWKGSRGYVALVGA